VLRADNPQASYTPLLPEVTAATSFNDCLRNLSTNAGAGNDIMVASKAAGQPYQFDGGAGNDLYVLSAYGANAVIGQAGPLQGLDRLYFALAGDVTKQDVANGSGGFDRIFTVTNGSSSASATVLDWKTSESAGFNMLDFVGQIHMPSHDPWRVTGLPLLLA
jgi:hypothetical protein